MGLQYKNKPTDLKTALLIGTAGVCHDIVFGFVCVCVYLREWESGTIISPQAFFETSLCISVCMCACVVLRDTNRRRPSLFISRLS